MAREKLLVTTLFIFGVCILALTFFIIFNFFKIGPLSPAPDIFILVDGQKYAATDQAIEVRVEPDKLISIAVELYHQNKLLNSGNFTYRWCFDPPVKENEYCLDNGYRGETYPDYKLEALSEQTLIIHIGHDGLLPEPVKLVFTPQSN